MKVFRVVLLGDRVWVFWVIIRVGENRLYVK